MKWILSRFCLLAIVLQCDGLGLIDQLDHIARRKAENDNGIPETRRRGMAANSVILGSPVYPYQLPKAEPVLPGHTLLRPAVGMLKSAVKFPHRELENGAGVYGHIDNLGIKYDGKQHRVLYSGFRRSMPGQRRQLQKLLNYNLNRFKRKKQPLRHSDLKKSNKMRRPLKKTLTIFPATLITQHKTIKKRKPIKNHPIRSYKKTLDEQKPVYYYFTRYDNNGGRNEKSQQSRNVMGAKREYTALNDVLKLIKSVRREDVEEQKDPARAPKKYVPGNVGLGSFMNTQQDSHEGSANKTKIFWDTKDSFNHIKISPEAPELAELLPVEAYDYVRNWWFYHQSDFEEFEDR